MFPLAAMAADDGHFHDTANYIFRPPFTHAAQEQNDDDYARTPFDAIYAIL